MGTILIGLGCMLAGLLVGVRMRRLCPDCMGTLPTHCDGCLSLWAGVEEAKRIHAQPTPTHSEWA